MHTRSAMVTAALWFEPPASGPGPITNRSRWPQVPSNGGVGINAPTKDGVSNYNQLVGDYANPILQPWAAARYSPSMCFAALMFGA